MSNDNAEPLDHLRLIAHLGSAQGAAEVLAGVARDYRAALARAEQRIAELEREAAEARARRESLTRIKAWQMNDYDTVAAHSAEEAVAWYKHEFGEDAADLDEDAIQEVDLSTMHFRDGANPAGGRCSMRECVYEQIGHMAANGLEFTPWVLSSTEF